MSYHKRMSLTKSIMRIFGYGSLFWNIGVGVIVLVLSEIFGLLEEVNEV